MNYKRLCHNRICRVLICLALICCLILQMVPARADATAAGLAAAITGVSSVSVAAPLAVGASLIALGVMADNTNPLVFENVVNDAVESLSAAGQWVKDGAVELLRTTDEAGNAMYYAAGEMLEGLRSWIFNENIVALGVPVPDHPLVSESDFQTRLSDAYDYPYVAISHSTYSNGVSVLWLFYGDYPISISSNSDGIILSSTGRNYRYEFRSDSKKYLVSATFCPAYDGIYGIYHTSDSNGISTSYDLSLGQISSVPVDGSSALDWAPEYQVNRLKVIEGGNDSDPDSDPPNDGKWFWPLALTAITAELFAMSQADQWSGVTPPEFSEYSNSADYEIVSRPGIDGYQGLEIKPVTNPNPGTGTNPDPDIGGDAGGDTGSDTGNQIDYTSWFRRIVELIEEFIDRFKTWVADCKTAIEELPSKFAKWFDNICETLGNIWEWCQNLVGSLIDALRNLLSSLFSPAPDFIANKVNSLTAKYPYLDTFTGLGGSLKSFFLNLGSKPPIIYIDLGAATGSYFFGGRQAFIDLTWYSDYKPTMDAILGAFIWLWLAWRVFHALPGIINGMSGTVGERVSYSGTQNINLPPLSPQNELPPGHNRRM